MSLDDIMDVMFLGAVMSEGDEDDSDSDDDEQLKNTEKGYFMYLFYFLF